MAHSDDLRERVVAAVVVDGVSRNAAARRFAVSVPSAVRCVARFLSTGAVSPAPTGGDRRSDRIEGHHDYLLGLIRRQPDVTLLEMRERLIANSKAYSKLKAHLRKIAERTVAVLLSALEACADIFDPAKCVNYFRACGYDTG